jgi:hypothetical protein
VADGPQNAAKQQPVEARQNAQNAVLEPLEKTLHDIPRDGRWYFHHAKNRLERLFLVAA